MRFLLFNLKLPFLSITVIRNAEALNPLILHKSKRMSCCSLETLLLVLGVTSSPTPAGEPGAAKQAQASTYLSLAWSTIQLTYQMYKI